MKKIAYLMTAVLIVLLFTAFAVASGDSEGETKTQTDASSGTGTTVASTSDDTALGNYNVVIKSFRLAKDYEGKDVVIIKYNFKNNDDDAVAFSFAFDDAAYQNGVGLTTAIILADNAKYDADNQLKELKKGSSLDVEVAYELDDMTTDVVVEVKELISFNETTITKTFKIAK